MIRLDNLTKKFGDFVAVDNLSLDVKEGEIIGLLGENGAGKTTLVNLLMGLYKPEKGEILIDGKNLNDFSEAEIEETEAEDTVEDGESEEVDF